MSRFTFLIYIVQGVRKVHERFETLIGKSNFLPFSDSIRDEIGVLKNFYP